MTIRGRITAGYLFLIVALSAVLAFQVRVITRLHSINTSLSSVSIQAATQNLSVLRELNSLETAMRNLLATLPEPGQPDKAPQLWKVAASGMGERLRQARQAVAQELQPLDKVQEELSDQEQAELLRLKRLWVGVHDGSLRVEDRQQRMMSRDRPPTGRDYQELRGLLDSLGGMVEAFRTQTAVLFRAVQGEIQTQAIRSWRDGSQAQFLSWLAAGIGLALSVTVGVFIVQSIQSSLQELKQGAELVAKGDFTQQVQLAGKDELSQFADSFNQMAQRLRELDDLKREFLAQVTHDLQSPLASMQETSQLFLDGLVGEISDEQREYLQLSVRSGERLSDLIQNILDLARMEAGVLEYKFERKDLRWLVKDLADEFQPRFQKRGLDLRAEWPEAPTWIRCDPVWMSRVISNLLENAIKFSPPKGTVSMLLDVRGPIPEEHREAYPAGLWNGDLAMLSVADSGPGIPDRLKETVFDKFYQVLGERKQRRKGSGLGLAICRKVVTAHHGAIWVEDNPSGGSIFRVLLRQYALSNSLARL